MGLFDPQVTDIKISLKLSPIVRAVLAYIRKESLVRTGQAIDTSVFELLFIKGEASDIDTSKESTLKVLYLNELVSRCHILKDRLDCSGLQSFESKTLQSV